MSTAEFVLCRGWTESLRSIGSADLPESREFLEFFRRRILRGCKERRRPTLVLGDELDFLCRPLNSLGTVLEFLTFLCDLNPETMEHVVQDPGEVLEVVQTLAQGDSRREVEVHRCRQTEEDGWMDE